MHFLEKVAYTQWQVLKKHSQKKIVFTILNTNTKPEVELNLKSKLFVFLFCRSEWRMKSHCFINPFWEIWWNHQYISHDSNTQAIFYRDIEQILVIMKMFLMSSSRSETRMHAASKLWLNSYACIENAKKKKKQYKKYRCWPGFKLVHISSLLKIQIRLNWTSRWCFILSRCNFCSLGGIPHDWKFLIMEGSFSLH